MGKAFRSCRHVLGGWRELLTRAGLLFFLFLVGLTPPAAATSDAPPVSAAPRSVASPAQTETPTQSGPPKAPAANVLGLSLAVQAPLSLDKKVPLGTGVVYTRLIFVSPRSALGVVAGLRVFPAAPLHLALGYGLSFQHYLSRSIHEGEPYGFYVTYGLLLQMNWLAERDGTATGHDTLLAIGYDFPAGRVLPTFQAGYHLTQVRGFDEETLWWPYTEVLVGLRF